MTVVSTSPSCYLGLAFAVVGGLFAVLGIGLGLSRRAFLSRARRVEGVVVGVKTSVRGTGTRRRTVYHPVVRYGFGGDSYDVAGAVGYDNPHPRGKPVFVLIDPAAPKTPVLDEVGEKWSNVIMSAVTSACFLVASAAVLLLG